VVGGEASRDSCPRQRRALGRCPYTWSQLYTLPTDPAKLKPKLIADFGQGGGPTHFEDVEFVLDDTPAPPAVREALFKVDASIPGVKVIGR